jgi:hypothetical protein
MENTAQTGGRICHPQRLQSGANCLDSARVFATSAPIKNERQRSVKALISLDSGMKQEAGK